MARSAEAHWLYERALDTLLLHGATPQIRIVVLHLGRLSSTGEAAIANDIAVRSPR